MTDFYKNPPKTKQDVRKYLTSWLEKVDDASPLEIEGEIFIQVLGFRRSFHSHCVFRSVLKNEYVWWVFEDFDLEKFPTNRFATYESLLETVINDYYIVWKLNE
jgi:hypothetical protein